MCAVLLSVMVRCQLCVCALPVGCHSLRAGRGPVVVGLGFEVASSCHASNAGAVAAGAFSVTALSAVNATCSTHCDPASLHCLIRHFLLLPISIELQEDDDILK